jgi:hypothetical protein
MSEPGTDLEKKPKYPPCRLEVKEPRREGSRLIAEGSITCEADLDDLKWHLRITRHRDRFFDDAVGREDGIDSMKAGVPFPVTIRDGKCKEGTHRYFAKLSVQNESFSDAKVVKNPKSKDYYVHIECK